MTNLNSNMFLAIFIGVALIAIIYYLNQNDDQPIQNHGTINNQTINNQANYPTKENTNVYPNSQKYSLGQNEVSDSIVDDLVAQYNQNDIDGAISASDPMSSEHGPFTNYGQKKQLCLRSSEFPYEDDDDHDPRDFTYKKQKFTRRTPEDVKDLFDVSKMLPQEIEDDWFDTEPLLSTKKIKGTHLIHPKVHMGVNTISGSLRNGTHDIRGDIVNPKIPISPWGNSTIEPDTNLKGICNPI